MFSFWSNINNQQQQQQQQQQEQEAIGENNNNKDKDKDNLIMNITHTTDKNITNSPTPAQQQEIKDKDKDKENEWIVGILTISDRVANGLAIDQSGPEIVSMIKSQLKHMMGGELCPINVTTVYKVVPDEIEHIQTLITQWTHLKYKLILTTGGTGFTPRDVTPEAIKPLLNRRAKGIEVAMLKKSLDITPHAMLSRPVAGIRDQTLIVTLPGSVKAIRENLGVILVALPHAIGLINSQPKSSLPESHRSKDYNNNNNNNNNSTNTSTTDTHTHQHTHEHEHTHHHHSCGGSGKRGSTYNMTPVEEAIKIILEKCKDIPEELENVEITKSLGRILGEDIQSKDPFPNFRASIKDGYAIRSKDGIGHYKLLGDSVAGGGSNDKLESTNDEKHCVRITTGARVPDIYDSVVMVEETEMIADNIVSIEVTVKPNQDIRSIGSDIPSGTIILNKGDKIGSAEIGLLATLGIQSVKCPKLPIISIISTGDELVDYKTTTPLGSGMIRDSNAPTLETILQEVSNHFGECCSRFQINQVGIIPDKLENLEKTLIETANKSDIIITSGGVSMGHLDLVKPLLEKIGKVHFGRVNMKPGKPLTFSTITSPNNNNNKTTLVFSLPGNPVSTVVTFYLFVVPALRMLSGFSIKQQTNLPSVQVKLLDRIALDHERPEYHRCFIEWDFNENCFVSKSTGSQASCRLLSLKQANALLVLPQKHGYLEKGSLVKAILIGPLTK